MSATATNLQAAFDQIDAFRAIHEPGGVTLEAVLCLQGAVGMDNETRVLIRDRLYADGEGGGSATFLGLIIGLLAAQMRDDGVAR